MPRDGTPCFDLITDQLEQAELTITIDRALRLLPEEQREVLVLKIWGELTFQQIADTLGSPLNTVAARYRYGLEKLRERMNSYERA
jgi:RNA polymerase sigma-70 factor (ECF subfamily)